MVALVGTGCSSGSSAGTDNASGRDKAVKFAECMRDNGVAEFPDPDASGELTIDEVVNGSSLDPSSATWENAVGACKGLQPPGFTGRKRNAQQQEHALEFAQCIRDNGVKDFPDPVAGAPLVDTNRIPSAATDGGMTILNAAMQKCGTFSEKLGVGSR
jgi:hypothetical protein